jgi:hypothetical protein
MMAAAAQDKRVAAQPFDGPQVSSSVTATARPLPQHRLPQAETHVITRNAP